MEKPGNPQRGHGSWTGMIVASGMLVAFLALLVSQAFAASMTVTSATIDDGTTVYPNVFGGEWITGGNLKSWTLTPNLTAGTVTTVSVSGAKSGGGNRSLRVQLLDGAATVISTGCVVVPAGDPFSVTVDVVPDVTFSTVARVRGLQVSAC